MDLTPPTPTPETVIAGIGDEADFDLRSHDGKDFPSENALRQLFGRHGEVADSGPAPSSPQRVCGQSLVGKEQSMSFARSGGNPLEHSPQEQPIPNFPPLHLPTALETSAPYMRVYADALRPLVGVKTRPPVGE